MKSLRARCRACSPNRISFDKHSSFTDRTQRSANAFKFGLRGGRVMHFTPPLAKRLPERCAELRITIGQNGSDVAEMPRRLINSVASNLLHPQLGGMPRDPAQGGAPRLKVKKK